MISAADSGRATIQSGEQVAANPFDLSTLVGAQLGRGSCQDVEDDEFSLGQVLADVALLFLTEVARQSQQFLQKFLNVAAAGVATFGQFLEPPGKVCAGFRRRDRLDVAVKVLGKKRSTGNASL